MVPRTTVAAGELKYFLLARLPAWQVPRASGGSWLRWAKTNAEKSPVRSGGGNGSPSGSGYTPLPVPSQPAILLA